MKGAPSGQRSVHVAGQQMGTGMCNRRTRRARPRVDPLGRSNQGRARQPGRFVGSEFQSSRRPQAKRTFWRANALEMLRNRKDCSLALLH